MPVTLRPCHAPLRAVSAEEEVEAGEDGGGEDEPFEGRLLDPPDEPAADDGADDHGSDSGSDSDDD